jgi:tetratricopeptide (TPR) repeat protein
MNARPEGSATRQASQDDPRVIGALEAYLAALEHGLRPQRHEFLQRYPEIAGALARALDGLEFIQSAAPHLKASSSPGLSSLVVLAEIRPEACLGDFRIVTEIGRGGMGIVYEAVQLSLGRRVALKILPFASTLDPRQLQRFQNEAQAAAQLNHRNIVPVFATGCERGLHYYAMQYIAGQTLAALIAELRQREEVDDNPWQKSQAATSLAPPQPSAGDSDHRTTENSTPPVAALSTQWSTRSPAFFRTVARLGAQAALALEHAHQVGVIHRDIKPANLLVETCPSSSPGGNAGDEGLRLWITDFGLAHCQSQAGLTMTGDVIGTLRYMSPEQSQGQRLVLDHRTDLYSLGATLYELLTLKPAFAGSDRQELVRQIASEDPQPPRQINPAVPVELDTIVRKLLEKNPADRYRTGQEVADDLQRFLQDEPIRARGPTPVQRLRKWSRRHRPVVWSALVSLLVALAMLAGSVGWVVRDQAERQARNATAVQAALREARQFQRQGKWPQGEAAAQGAATLLATGGGSAELQQDVREILADLHLLAQLENARLLRSGVKEGHFDNEAGDRAYASAFGSYGIDIERLELPEAAAQIAARPIRVELAAALDDWAQARRWIPQADGKSWRDLLALAQAADPDPWRTALREALTRRDRRALAERAAAADTGDLPAATLVLLAECLWEVGESDKAITLLRRAQEEHADDFWINHSLAFHLADGRPPHPEEAIPYYRVAVALRPDSPGARLDLGNALAATDRFDEALAAYRQAVRLKQDYAEAHCNLGIALQHKGRLDEAITAYHQALALKPNLVEGHVNLGNALEEKGCLDEAVASHRRAIHLRPELPEAYNNLGNALRKQGRLDAAIDACRQALARKRDYAEAYNNLGFALHRKGQMVEAVAACRRAISLKPDLAEAHFNLGFALEAMGCPDEALAAYRRVTELKPDFVDALNNLGLILQKKGRLDEALTAYRKAIARKPGYADAHYNLGNALRDLGHYAEAVAAYRRAVALQPTFAEAYCNLGIILRQQGEFAQALAALKRGHELGSQRTDWPYPSAHWVDDCRQLGGMAVRLPAFLRGEAQPVTPAERNAFALFCYDQQRYVTAARLWASDLIGDRKPADDLEASRRQDAADAAALAGTGLGAEASQLNEQERARWRKQAREWLRAELVVDARLLASGTARDRQRVRRWLRIWQNEPDLAGLRDPAAVARLPADEQQACRQLWAEVQALLARAEAAE